VTVALSAPYKYSYLLTPIFRETSHKYIYIYIYIYTFLNLEITNNGANFGDPIRHTKATRLSVWNFAA